MCVIFGSVSYELRVSCAHITFPPKLRITNSKDYFGTSVYKKKVKPSNNLENFSDSLICSFIYYIVGSSLKASSISKGLKLLILIYLFYS